MVKTPRAVKASNAKRMDVVVQEVGKTSVERSQELLNFINVKFPTLRFKSLFYVTLMNDEKRSTRQLFFNRKLEI